jgi:hypothetical protein
MIKTFFSIALSKKRRHNPDVVSRNFQQHDLQYIIITQLHLTLHKLTQALTDKTFSEIKKDTTTITTTKKHKTKNTVDDVNNFQRKSYFYFSFDADLDRVRWMKKKNEAKLKN